MNQRYTLYYDTIALSICIVGMILSKSLVSISVVLLAFRFLFLGSWKEKIGNLKAKKILLMVLLLYPALHIVSLLWSSNITEGLFDINKKIALIVIPLVLCAISPLDKKTIKTCFIVYLTAIFIGTIWGSVNFFTHNYTDTRTLMGGSSHIRFALNITFAIACMIWFVYNERKSLDKRMSVFLCLYIVWLLCYVVFAQLTTAEVLLVSIAVIGTTYFCIKHFRTLLAKILLVLYLAAIVTSVVWVRQEYKAFFKPNVLYSQALPQQTSKGNIYYCTNKEIIENGNYVYCLWNPDEIKSAWKKRTGKEIGDKFDVLLRYLNSVSPYKDYEHTLALTDEDINNINNGIENKVYANHFSLKPRLYKLFWQINSYRNFGQVKNFSELQRLALWQNALQVIKDNFIIGCGCGDVHEVFADYLCKDKSQLCGMNLKAHNQYLYTFATFGLLGFLVFLVYLFYPPIKQKVFKSGIYYIFFFILCASMISEDTLDSVQGIMFFILPNAIMLFNKEQIMAMNKVEDNKFV